MLQAPAQIEAGLADTETLGRGFTVTLTVLVLLHPAVLPVTVKAVVASGVTVIVPPAILPGSQTYPVAPVAESVEELPEQIVAGEAEALTVGLGTTVN